MTERSSSTRRWAIGCGLLALIPVVAVLIVTTRTMVPLQSAGRDDRRLEELYGPPEAFTPPSDGAIPAARLEAFLDVRRSLGPVCDSFSELSEPIERVDSLDADDTTGRDVAEATKGIVGVAANITPLVGEFFEARNRALVASQMGLGEYTYIFSMAYHEQLTDPGVGASPFAEVGPRVHEALRTMLDHQLSALPPDAESSRQTLEREIEVSKQAPGRLPWSDGLPVAVTASLTPYRAQLDALFCPMPIGIEMDRDSARALKLALY